jgi:hypothetical protein
MTTPVIALVRYGTDLSSRATGSAVRNIIDNAIAVGATSVTVDCAGIRTLSESFADEVFGILVSTHGKPWFKNHVAVIGLTDSTRTAILRAVHERLSLSAAT